MKSERRNIKNQRHPFAASRLLDREDVMTQAAELLGSGNGKFSSA
jgi:hypothetical protein